MKRTLFLFLLFGVGAAAAEIPRAPDGVYSDAAKLFSGDERRMIRMRMDFFLSGTGTPLFLATFPSAQERPLGEVAAEIFTQWHARENRLPDDSILLLVFGQEHAARVVLGPSVPKQYEDALAGLPEPRFEPARALGAEIEKLIAATEDRLDPVAVSLKRSNRSYFVPPPPRSYLLDGEGRLTDEERRRVEAGLGELARSSGHTILVALDSPGMKIALGDVPRASQWIQETTAAWSRERPELENGAIIFCFATSGLISTTIHTGLKVESRVPQDVLADLSRDLYDACMRANFDRAILRVAGTLDQRFAGKKTLSVRSPLYAVLHPWRIATGPDEDAPLGLRIGASAFVLYFLGWFLYLLITNPKLVLFTIGGMVLSGVIGSVSPVAGKIVGGFTGGGGSAGGGGSSGKW